MNDVVEDYPSESDSEGAYKYDLGRVMNVNKLGPNPKPSYVKITPSFVPKLPWTTDSVVKKSFLSEKYYWKIRNRNTDIKLQHTKVQFKPYSTDTTVPLLGSIDARLTHSM